MKDFQASAAYLLQECFEGRPEGQDYTWFVEGKKGILNGLEEIDAAQASIRPSDRCSSIAAHAYHILYALRGANAQRGGPEPEGTWEDSWKKQEATPEEWEQLKSDIRAEYQSLVEWFRTNQTWDQDGMIVGALAMVPHMSFHLGAIRQILKVI